VSPEDLLDLAGIDVESAGDDEIIFSVYKVEESILIRSCEVPVWSHPFLIAADVRASLFQYPCMI